MAIESASPALRTGRLRSGNLITLAGPAGGSTRGTLPWLTVVVPTRDEESNVGLLLDRLGPVLSPLGADLLVVDDSEDGTPEALARCAPACTVPVRLLHRPPGSRAGGLGSAVVAGAARANGSWVLVMDADLQHPPEAVGVLAYAAAHCDADIVVGTRYADSGAAADGLGARRGLISSLATRLVRMAFPGRLATVSDPLSGLFAFRRAAVDLAGLRPTGFKILMEILVRNPHARVAEVAYRFAPRHSGTSKASLREGVSFLSHLLRLRGAPRPAARREPPPAVADPGRHS